MRKSKPNRVWVVRRGGIPRGAGAGIRAQWAAVRTEVSRKGSEPCPEGDEGGVWGGRRLTPGVQLSPEWGGGQYHWEVSPEFQQVGVGGKGVASVPYLPRSAARPGGSGWQTRTRRWPGGHVAPSGPTWLQTRRRPRLEVRPQLPQRPGALEGGGGVYTTQNSAEPGGGGAGSARVECVACAAWTPVPSAAHPSAVTGGPAGRTAGGPGCGASWGGEAGAGGPGETTLRPSQRVCTFSTPLFSSSVAGSRRSASSSSPGFTVLPGL